IHYTVSMVVAARLPSFPSGDIDTRSTFSRRSPDTLTASKCDGRMLGDTSMSTLAKSGQPSALAVFRNRAFTLLWSAQLISVAGSALGSLAAAILVYRMTGSALSVGLVLIAAAVPGLLVGLVAGVFV